MTGWQAIAGERLMLYSPIGLNLIDDLTGKPAQGELIVTLDERDSVGDWHETRLEAVRSLSNVLLYPGLGRSAAVAATPVRRYRIRIDTLWYRPDYLMTDAGIEFDVHPYDDDTPPAATASHPMDLFLLPSANYPFPRHLRVLRGVVVDSGGDPVANVEVVEGPRERVLTDARGEFALPLRWTALSGPVQIDAVDHRTGHNGSINVVLPADLSHSNTITIN
ncbi:MAG: carboxypeptidase-like regulatory domain-containing protein [Candidatus Thiodiazotropha sp. (ex Epidulcina cf. delphinae)]|nr:carboxypeptidase-like regulatory domain-containing protein [Candidatus Thiodiazotropha sp. (ex Epidulcina cf. delphinae)]